MSFESNDQGCDSQCSTVEGEALTPGCDDDQGGTPVSPRRDRVDRIVAGRDRLSVMGQCLTGLYDCGIRGIEAAADDANHMWWLGFCSAVELIAMEAHD